MKKLTTVRNTRQVLLSASVTVKLASYSENRVTLAVIPKTATTLYVGASENVSATSGYAVLQGAPFIAIKEGIDPTQELWAAIDAAAPTACVYEDLASD